MKNIRGKVWKFGNNIDTDIIIPSEYCVLKSMREMSRHAMEPIFQSFSDTVTSGDIIVGGINFGCGSSREQAPMVLKELGISAIVAKSFARIFLRNSINIGLPVFEHSAFPDHISSGDYIEIFPDSGKIQICKTENEFEFIPMPDFMLDILNAGGLAGFIKTREGF
jgi:3-isopropylmalate/(R)-2-methylmalate dehydratase small subunit